MTDQFQELDGDCTFVLCSASPHFFHGTSNMTSNNKTEFCEMEASGMIMVFFPQKAKDTVILTAIHLPQILGVNTTDHSSFRILHTDSDTGARLWLWLHCDNEEQSTTQTVLAEETASLSHLQVSIL